MESKVKLLGHPVHPMLVVFPVGLLTSATVFDAIYHATGRAGLAAVSFWNIAVGVFVGLIAAVVGLVDWLAIPHGTRAKRVGLLHAVSNAVVLLLFATAWLTRKQEPLYVPTSAAFVLEILGTVLAVLSGWLGGELVDRLGVGVDYGANLNAPSSLSGKPALPLQARGGGQTKGGGHAKGPTKGGRPMGSGPRLVHSHTSRG